MADSFERLRPHVGAQPVKGEPIPKTLLVWPIVWALAVFATVVFTLDVLLGVLFPDWWVMQKAWELLLPGFSFISWGSFVLGLVESFIGGWLTAVGFVVIYNFFASRKVRQAASTLARAGEHH